MSSRLQRGRPVSIALQSNNLYNAQSAQPGGGLMLPSVKDIELTLKLHELMICLCGQRHRRSGLEHFFCEVVAGRNGGCVCACVDR